MSQNATFHYQNISGRAFYYSLVKNEECYLKDTFGQEYEDYATKVNRFIPNFKGIKTSLAMYQYDWKKVLRKEYGTIALVLCGLLAMTIWKDMTIFGYGHKRIKIIILATMFIPVVLFYGITRYLKKPAD